jgi:hypothetical protein
MRWQAGRARQRAAVIQRRLGICETRSTELTLGNRAEHGTGHRNAHACASRTLGTHGPLVDNLTIDWGDKVCCAF